MLAEKAVTGLGHGWRVVEVEILTLAQAAPAESMLHCAIPARRPSRKVQPPGNWRQ
jgi:hypothetical protein